MTTPHTACVPSGSIHSRLLFHEWMAVPATSFLGHALSRILFHLFSCERVLSSVNVVFRSHYYWGIYTVLCCFWCHSLGPVSSILISMCSLSADLPTVFYVLVSVLILFLSRILLPVNFQPIFSFSCYVSQKGRWVRRWTSRRRCWLWSCPGRSSTSW